MLANLLRGMFVGQAVKTGAAFSLIEPSNVHTYANIVIDTCNVRSTSIGRNTGQLACSCGHERRERIKQTAHYGQHPGHHKTYLIKARKNVETTLSTNKSLMGGRLLDALSIAAALAVRIHISHGACNSLIPTCMVMDSSEMFAETSRWLFAARRAPGALGAEAKLLELTLRV